MNPEWTSLLVCPFCKGKLYFHSSTQGNEYWCFYDGIAFPIEGTTPIFLDSVARTLSVEEKLNKKK